jgi:uncharacterized protein YqeY
VNSQEKIKKDLVEALKRKDGTTVSTLRFLLAAVKNYEIEKGGAGYSATDEDVTSVIGKQVKQRKESIEQFKSGGRSDLVEKETKELEILKKYLPEQLSEEEIQKLVDEKIKETGVTSSADIGKVMGVLSGELKGKADMGTVSTLVKRSLGR